MICFSTSFPLYLSLLLSLSLLSPCILKIYIKDSPYVCKYHEHTCIFTLHLYIYASAEKTIKALSEESQSLRDALSEKEEEVRGLLTLNEQLLLRAEKALEKRFYIIRTYYFYYLYYCDYLLLSIVIIVDDCFYPYELLMEICLILSYFSHFSFFFFLQSRTQEVQK
jgi:uncharacterized membrane protein